MWKFNERRKFFLFAKFDKTKVTNGKGHLTLSFGVQGNFFGCQAFPKYFFTNKFQFETLQTLEKFPELFENTQQGTSGSPESPKFNISFAETLKISID